MNKKLVIAGFLLFFISRVFFINAQDVFFDSGEYLNLFAEPNYIHAIVSGHFPPHEGYIILFWPVFQLAKILHLNPGNTVVIVQILLGMLTIYCFYQFLLFISNKKTALIGTIIASLTPLFWIVNTTIMMENAYITSFFVSVYFLTKYLHQKNGTVYLHFSLLFFVFTFLTQPVTVIWFPFLIFLVYYKNKQKLKAYVIWLFCYLGLTILANVTFVSFATGNNWPGTFHHIYDDKNQEFTFSPTLHGILVFLRDFIIPLMRNNTSLVIILGIISLLLLFKQNKKLFCLTFLWFIPSAYANQWWDSLFVGRHSLIAGFGVAFLVSYLIQKNNKAILVVLCYLLVVTLPAIFLLKAPVPYIQEENYVKTLPKNALFIEGHFAQPQVNGVRNNNLMVVNTPFSDMSNAAISQKIDIFLKTKKAVYISSIALTDPYGLYNGPYLHTLSLSYDHPYQLDPMITKYTLKKYKVINSEDNVIIYKITSKKKSVYPVMKNLKNSYRRIDFYDPLWRMYTILLSFLPQKPQF